ncbi:MAG: TRAP transporter small permease subunit [Rhodospirillales bacterium]|nr:TRAP transporter small permease subunit [Rhodospirillales bacterium]
MNSLLDRFEIGFNRFTHICAALVAVSIALMTFLIPLNLFMVKAQLGGIWWLFEGVEYVLYMGVFIGAPWVLQKNAHVKVDVLLVNLPKNAAVKLERFIDFLGLVICGLLCFYGMRATHIEWIDGTLPDKDLRIANWLVLSVFALSFAMLTIEFLLRMRRAKSVLSKEDTAGSEAGL